MMKIVAAIDSFKGSATSAELNQAVLSGFSDQWEKCSIPIADGEKARWQQFLLRLEAITKRFQ